MEAELLNANFANVTTILSIALITIFALLILTFIKVQSLKMENEKLKDQIDK